MLTRVTHLAITHCSFFVDYKAANIVSKAITVRVKTSFSVRSVQHLVTHCLQDSTSSPSKDKFSFPGQKKITKMLQKPEGSLEVLKADHHISLS